MKKIIIGVDIRISAAGTETANKRGNEGIVVHTRFLVKLTRRRDCDGLEGNGGSFLMVIPACI